jgi:hypothetical protein
LDWIARDLGAVSTAELVASGNPARTNSGILPRGASGKTVISCLRVIASRFFEIELNIICVVIYLRKLSLPAMLFFA